MRKWKKAAQVENNLKALTLLLATIPMNLVICPIASQQCGLKGRPAAMKIAAQE